MQSRYSEGDHVLGKLDDCGQIANIEITIRERGENSGAYMNFIPDE